MFNRDQLLNANEQWETHGYAVIDNFIQEPYYSALSEYVRRLKYGLWACISNSHSRYPDSYIGTPEYNKKYLDHLKHSKGQFSYWHYAYWLLKDYHMIDTNPLVTEFNQTITQKENNPFTDLVRGIISQYDMYTNEPTYSYYNHKSWLNAHHDPNRYCAYIFYFNDTWITQWGGQLCILHDDEKTIKHSIEPIGNRIVLLNVQEPDGKKQNKHFISPVSVTAEEPRYSLAGWFYPTET
jgi:Rps23 Pro-64 3,4-dihydroxylase Tpa1-like proline 4-hydroxylase